MKSALMSNIISLNVDTIKFTAVHRLILSLSQLTYHLRTIENTLLVNCILMCFIIFCFTAGALALYRSVGGSLYYYGVYEFVTRKTRSDCVGFYYDGFVKCATKAMFTLYRISFCFVREMLRPKCKQLPPPPIYAVVFSSIYY
jgi:hypothetical protein